MNLKTQGFVLLDVDVVALNNAGKNTSSNYENAVATKKVSKNGRTYVYVSGQAWRYWWREALQKNHGWQMSPITRESKIAFTDANPMKFEDDDVFGYMKATKEEEADENGKIILDSKGKPKKTDATVTRISPLKNSVIVSVAPTRVYENWSSMSRQEGDAVPYAKDEYSAIMKGMFSLDLAQVGTFSSYNRTGFKNLTELLKEEALKIEGSEEIADAYVKNNKGEFQKLIRLSKSTRLKRAKETIQALKTISGGAMQTNNMGDVTPKFIILASMKTGNHPFSHVAKSEEANRNDSKAELNIEGLIEVLKDYKDQFVGSVFVGRRSGFMDEHKVGLEALKDLGNDYPTVKVLSINEAIDQYCLQLDTQMP
jgi:CRISPR-associated protein Cst2